MPEITFLKIFLDARVAHARRSQAGASAVEWVVITALLIGIALAVGAVVMTKLRGKADSLDLNTP